jgi:hypothetical protein
MEPLRSRHGLILQYVEGEALVVDGAATYVDDLLDCFESYSGKGSLKSHCVRCFSSEVRILKEFGDQSGAVSDPLFQNHFKLREHLLQLLNGEPEDGLATARFAWQKSPEKTVETMLAAARKGQKFVIATA